MNGTPRKITGFTLIELIMVLVITGILAIVALPRFMGRQAFEAQGFYDQTLSMLRYAQKNAIAQGTVTYANVNSATGTVCLTYVADSNCTVTDPNEIVLNPAEQRKFSNVAPSGITIGTSSASFSFSALGKPSPDASVQLSIVGDGTTRTINVERETGYVH